MKLCRCGLSPQPKGQFTKSGLTESYIGRGAGVGLAERLSKAERGFCVWLGHRGCVLNKYFGVQLLQTV